MNRTISIIIVVVFLLVGAFFSFNQYIYNEKQGDMSQNSNIEITPIEHATLALKVGEKIIYADPVGGGDAFLGIPEPDMVLITDIHGDHYDEDTLKAVLKDKTIIIVPKAVAEKLPSDIVGTIKVLNNGETLVEQGITILAIPMYNLPESAEAYHTKGRGNGYVLEGEGKRIYISGDTADIPGMRSLQNIDMAFVAMNLPYTMDVESAASAVLEFKPKQVFPYHYRQKDGFSDVNKFKELVNAGDQDIKVGLLNWYPEQE